MAANHPAQRRYFAEALVRQSPAAERRRALAPQRAARIDPNPHQIEAVVFALARLKQGGCILADEVGLGKTIEAGLVITQLLAEGARRVLLIAPKSLLGQWKDELRTLFGLETREGSATAGFEGDGVFLVNREAAGSERGRDALLESARFDLCVIDEAHEVFAGIYKRFSHAGTYDDEAPGARLAGRVRQVLNSSDTPVLLLTATPIQNNLAELWGLVQYVDREGTLLGDLPTFREIFCDADDRQVARGLEAELKGRLEQVLQRTLRRQAQAFLERPFVARQARLFDYVMSAAERSLFDDVTAYLLEPGIRAFQGRQRALLLLGFHRRMASSTRALAASLGHVVERLRGLSRGEALETDVADLDDDELRLEAEPAAAPVPVDGEISRVESFIRRAEAVIHDDGRFRALLRAVDFVASRAKAGQGSNKLVIFTESLVTQAYLRESLVASGVVTDDEVTLFRGDNETARAAEALRRWQTEAPLEGVTRELALRLALVHEFKTRSRVFISTEAGAKGLNLQFCNTVVNWDLPWNPQRIEQRIGRCHRYGQAHDVTVINFLARDNEAQALTFEILSQKLELFGTVLDASDHVLHRPTGPGGEVLMNALGAEFESELARIYERARSLDEVHAELRALRERVAEERRRFEELRERTVGLIERSFDDEVQQVFRGHKAAMPATLETFDRDLWRVVQGYLDTEGIGFERVRGQLTLQPDTRLPAGLASGGVVAPLHLGHPLVEAAVKQARRLPVTGSMLAPKVGPAKTGRLRLCRVRFDGFERVDLVVPVLVTDDGGVVSVEATRELLEGELLEGPVVKQAVDDAVIDDAQAERLFGLQREVDAHEHERFERAWDQLERYLADLQLLARRRRESAVEKLALAEQRRDGVTGAQAREQAEAAVRRADEQLDATDHELARLALKDDARYRAGLERAQARRYLPPVVEVLFDLTVVFR